MSEFSAEAAQGAAPLSKPHRMGVLTLLMLIYLMNLLDRQLPFILAESIRRELRLSDSQLGLLGGVAFAFVYATMSLPLGRLADLWSPKWVLTGSAMVWSAMTAFGAGATSFVQLSIARVGVALGEAGCVPSAHALISRLVKPEARATTIAVFMVGSPLGLMAGLALGGALSDRMGWRGAFLVIGLAGIALAAVFALVAPDRRSPPGATQASWIEAMRHLFAIRSFTHLCVGSAVLGVGGYAVITFGGTYVMRTFGWTATQAGLGLGFANGVGGALGTVASGLLADRLGRRRPAWSLMVPSVALFAAAIFFGATFLVPAPMVAIVLLTVALFLNFCFIAPSFAAAQAVAPQNMRATASALLVLSSGLVGASAGPVIVGMLSDMLKPRFGLLSLRYALMVVPAMVTWAAIHFLLAARSFDRDLAGARAAHEHGKVGHS